MKFVNRYLIVLALNLLSTSAFADWVKVGKFVCTQPGKCEAACLDLQASDWWFQDPYDSDGITCECRCKVPGSSLGFTLKYSPANDRGLALVN